MNKTGSSELVHPNQNRSLSYKQLRGYKMADMVASTPSSDVKYSRTTSGWVKFTELISVNTVYITVKG